MADRFLNPVPQFLTPDGQVLADGRVYFYESGTNTPKNTFSDPDLTTPNLNPVELDSAGQPETDIWLDGVYRVVLESADSTQRWARDNVPAPLDESGLVIPALVDGQFLTNNGTSLLWSAIRQVPDPSGSADYILSTDGTNLLWVPQPEPPEPPPADVATTDSSIRVINKLDQWGTGSAPASGGKTTSTSVTFGTPMLSCHHVTVTPTVNIVTPIGYSPVTAVTSKSGTGFTVNFDVNADQAGANITVPVTFTWRAVGTVVVPTE